jgi:hypothetical protein
MIDVRVTRIQFDGKPFGFFLFKEFFACPDAAGDRGHPMNDVCFHTIRVWDETVCLAGPGNDILSQNRVDGLRQEMIRQLPLRRPSA